jgi:hypothetical protein
VNSMLKGRYGSFRRPILLTHGYGNNRALA